MKIYRKRIEEQKQICYNELPLGVSENAVVSESRRSESRTAFHFQNTTGERK